VADPETGVQWLVAVDTADDLASPNWLDLPQQRSGELNLPRNNVEANSKEDAGWETAITVSRGWNITFSGLSDENDTALLFVIDTKALGATTDVTINVRLTNQDGDTYIGTGAPQAVVTSFPYDGVVTYSSGVDGRGAWTAARA
jgi:hypothetical protein